MALTDNLVAYYKFDNGALTTDSVGAFTLTNNNSVSNTISGFIGYGADFGATNTNKSLTRASNLGIDGGNVSISAWINRDSSDFILPVTLQGATSDVAYRLKYESGIKAVRDKFNVGEQQTNAQAVALNTWTHIVLTYDGTDIKCYVNAGTPESTTASGSGTGTTTSAFSIGSDLSQTATPQNFYDGKIDEVAVWTRAITSTEVTQLYNSGAGNQYPFLNAYTIVCDVGSFALTGINVGLLYGRKLVMEVGSFALTGINVAFNKGYGMLADVGNFILTGINVALKLKRWTNASKSNTINYTNASKSNTTNWTNQTK